MISFRFVLLGKKQETMAKKAKNAKKKKMPDPGNPPSKPVENVQDESEKPFDFGGIPARDLKKNLGC
jgi:hypothetical protein